ncbi:MAG: ABC transporter permease [Oscillospiraceae bacterium]|nr:ABC transporter permease [Oscillospiraceae bacterium]
MKAKTLKGSSKIGKILQNMGSILLFLVIWELAVHIFDIREAFLCTPSSAVYHLLVPQPDANYHWSVNILTTLKEYVISFAFVAAGGIALAILISWSKTIQGILMPAFIFICSLPMIAIAPILLIWIGYGLKTNVLVAFLVSFFPMVINTITGLGAQDKQLLDLVRYLGANRWQVLLKIQLPGALPYIFSGLKISSSLCIMGVIVGELIASDKGLGYVIVNAQLTMDTPPMFASLIMMSLLGWGMYLLVSLCERLLTPWNFVKERVDS